MSLFFLVTDIFVFLRFPGFCDRGMGREDLKSPINGTSTPSDVYGPIRGICVLILLGKSGSLLSTGLSPAPPQSPASWCSWFLGPKAGGCRVGGPGSRNVLEGKRSKSSFQVRATAISSPHLFTPILFHLIFSTTLRHVFSHFEDQINFPSRGASLFTLKLCSLLSKSPFPQYPTNGNDRNSNNARVSVARKYLQQVCS